MTAPLVPADADLQDFPYMPLDVRRMRDSDLAALESPEACWAAVLLWAASWHQLPAASLPDDDRVLANLAGYGRVVKEWQRVKDGALRGWIKCDDGRLYHPVVAEKALEAWDSKLHHAHSKLKERLRKSYGKDAKQPTFDQWISAGRPNDWPQSSAGIPESSAGIPAENSLKGEGEGEGEGKGKGYVNLKPVDDTQGISPSRAGAVCVALRAEGLASVNPSHPELLALLNDGAEIQEFVSAARIAREKGKGFAYVIGIVKGQRADAQRLAEEASTKPKRGESHARHDVEEPA